MRSAPVPWIALALALAGAAVALAPPRDAGGFDVARFARLPVLEGGRVKPIDSVARNSLLAMRGHQSFREDGRTIGADEWLLDLLFRPDVAARQKVFQIDDPEVLGLLGLPQTSDRYFALATLAPHLDEIERQARAAQPLDAKRRTRFQSATLILFERLSLYYRLQNTIQLAGRPGLLTEVASASSPEASQRQAVLAAIAYFRPIPPLTTSGPDAWRSTGEALRAAAAGTADPALAQWGRLGIAWAARDPSAFAGAVVDLERTAALAAPRLAAVRRASDEALFNRAQPFYSGMVIYVLALLVLFASWLRWGDLLRPAAYGLLVAGALVHTAGLVSRVVLQGRPPVTNLYSSAIFVGWAAVVVGIVLERVYRRGFGTAVAAASGFASLIVAHHLATDGDTMEMMRAVLDSNFWLATHVVTITVGYSGTFLAGAIAIGWAVREQVAPRLDPATTKALSGMVYGVVCFALFFSFVGTVLGGIWADQSWGRFWGWDPKENGALLIVLWNAMILHARWAGYVRTRGIMAMAIFGNVITSLSWFGVNMLGVGLHSYGFMDKAFWALAGFDASQLALIGLALVPRRFFRRGEAFQEV
jgi:ABC-type transport system involved in cytochrome c biogenesis permease subunit